MTDETINLNLKYAEIVTTIEDLEHHAAYFKDDLNFLNLKIQRLREQLTKNVKPQNRKL